MYIEQIYTNSLAQACYYIESEGEAAIIDPLRDPGNYLHILQKRNAKLKYIFLTHFHADFISGHLDLQNHTGAEIILGPDAEPGYKITNAADGSEFHTGKSKIVVLHTPGHTLESICLLLIDENKKHHALFTGDTLFIGDVGRPDLMSGNCSATELAGMLYNSINKIKQLPKDILIYPGHGAGSLCGKNIGTERWTTLGEQLNNNYALQNLSKKDFINKVLKDLTEPPAYFFEDARINKTKYKRFDEVIKKSLKPLGVKDFENNLNEALILDTRPVHLFELGFIKDAISIGLNGEFEQWVGALIDINQPLLIVPETGKEKEVISRLAGIGFDNVIGFFENEIKAWKQSGNNLETVESIDAFDFCYLYDTREFIILDVRKDHEVKKEKILSAIHIPLHKLQARMDELDRNEKYIIYCAGGYRSMIAASMMKRAGINNVMNVSGGMVHLKQAIPALIH